MRFSTSAAAQPQIRRNAKRRACSTTGFAIIPSSLKWAVPRRRHPCRRRLCRPPGPSWAFPPPPPLMFEGDLLDRAPALKARGHRLFGACSHDDGLAVVHRADDAGAGLGHAGAQDVPGIAQSARIEPSIRAMTRGYPTSTMAFDMLGHVAFGGSLFRLLLFGFELLDRIGCWRPCVRRRRTWNLELGGRLFQLGLDPVHMRERTSKLVTASMRRTFAPTLASETILTKPISAVLATWHPPHSSRENSPASTTRTTSPYFSPNKPVTPGFAGGVEGRFVDGGGRSLHDGLVGDALDLGDLLGRHALEMGEVEAQAVGADVAAACLTCSPRTRRKGGMQQGACRYGCA